MKKKILLLKKILELLDDCKISIEKTTSFCIFLILLIFLDTIIFKYHNLWSDKVIVLLLMVSIAYLFIIKSVIKDLKPTIYVYMSILTIVLICFFHANNFYYVLPLVLLIAIGPLLNFRKILLCLLIATIFNILYLHYFKYPILNLNELLMINIFILIYSQILYVNYKRNLYDKFLLNEKNKKLLVQVETDKLTGLLNRYGIKKKLERLSVEKDFSNKSCALLLLDLDYFKSYNDTFGHLKGDECLKKVSKQLKLSIKSKFDFIARFGGEEFIIFIYNVDEKQSIDISKRICKNIKDLKILASNSANFKYVTISIGVAMNNPNAEFDFYKLVKEADKQLYLVKNEKKNAVALNNNIYAN
ncbi:MAG: GGDEF domain-containing protein [Bacilli bacterium]|nr:GGDEF domain-containing protein [Bacilli bacterium]MDD4406982.1 GGDEF domain-containing protein [Bacilli bacterium]